MGITWTALQERIDLLVQVKVRADVSGVLVMNLVFST